MSERRQCDLSGFSIVDFEQVNASWVDVQRRNKYPHKHLRWSYKSIVGCLCNLKEERSSPLLSSFAVKFKFAGNCH